MSDARIERWDDGRGNWGLRVHADLPLKIGFEGDPDSYRRGLQLRKPEDRDGSAGPARTRPTK